MTNFSKISKIRRLKKILTEAIEIIEDYRFFKDNKLMINILAYVLEKLREEN
ncbi:hypothetical protein HZY83_07455 [Gemella sp. GH3]|uniref:hypothetical protein n=1 Tax=unclassified Gemella TaxID=2624949 RepID=UPI0015D07E4A|nr:MULTISPECIES: hypothetical protein [unclassified Gemella]MBF0714510.1 hypothetical protein [Gemella sp. GH3.1]NYS51462.1 hypothetical protein [Gemella sp. GH3]